MSTTYYAVPREMVIKAGIEHLFQESALSLLEKAAKRLQIGEYGGRTFPDDPDSPSNVEGVVELGGFSYPDDGPRFKGNIRVEELAEILRGDYIIMDERHKLQSTEEFKEELRKSGYEKMRGVRL